MAALSDVITPFENQKTNSYPFHASPVDAAPPPFSFPSLNFPSPVRGTFRLNRITRTRNGRFRFSLTQKFEKKKKKRKKIWIPDFFLFSSSYKLVVPLCVRFIFIYDRSARSVGIFCFFFFFFFCVKVELLKLCTAYVRQCMSWRTRRIERWWRRTREKGGIKRRPLHAVLPLKGGGREQIMDDSNETRNTRQSYPCFTWVSAIFLLADRLDLGLGAILLRQLLFFLFYFTHLPIVFLVPRNSRAHPFFFFSSLCHNWQSRGQKINGKSRVC